MRATGNISRMMHLVRAQTCLLCHVQPLSHGSSQLLLRPDWNRFNGGSASADIWRSAVDVCTQYIIMCDRVRRLKCFNGWRLRRRRVCWHGNVLRSTRYSRLRLLLIILRSWDTTTRLLSNVLISSFWTLELLGARVLYIVLLFACASIGATRDIGSALTRLCLRHRNIESKLKSMTGYVDSICLL